MRALVADRSAPAGVSLREAPDPEPGPGEALIEVRAVSLNRGEVRRLPMREEGTTPGWDVAGVVRRG
jgi:NADPH2:quinone reductase